MLLHVAFYHFCNMPGILTVRQTPELKNHPPYSFVHFYLVDFSLTDTSICRSVNQAVCHISRDVKYDHTVGSKERFVDKER